MKAKFYILALVAALGFSALSIQINASTNKKPTSTKQTTKSTKPKEIPEALVIDSQDVDKSLPYHLSGGAVYTSPTLNKTNGTYKDFAKTTWYSVKEYTIDRSPQGKTKGNSKYIELQNGSKTQTIWVWHGFAQPINEGTFDIATKNSEYFKNKKVISLGDSITYGYDGEENLDCGYTTWLNRYLNTSVENAGGNGAYLAVNNSQKDFTSQVNSRNFKDYDVATIAYGTNDYGHSVYQLSAITDVLQDNINKMKHDNKNLIIYGILPITRYDNNLNDDNVIGKGGYTVNELRDALANVYKANNIPVLDWRDDDAQLITDQNFKYRLNDHHLHPTARTYQMMGREISRFMIDDFPKDKIKKDVKKPVAKKVVTNKNSHK